jgi:hypothetical protein
MFIRDWDDKKFDCESEAFEDACNEMVTDMSVEDYLKPHISYDALLSWAMEQDGFFDFFDDELYKAQRDYFNDFYVEMEDDATQLEDDE